MCDDDFASQPVFRSASKRVLAIPYLGLKRAAKRRPYIEQLTPKPSAHDSQLYTSAIDDEELRAVRRRRTIISDDVSDVDVDPMIIDLTHTQGPAVCTPHGGFGVDWIPSIAMDEIRELSSSPEISLCERRPNMLSMTPSVPQKISSGLRKPQPLVLLSRPDMDFMDTSTLESSRTVNRTKPHQALLNLSSNGLQVTLRQFRQPSPFPSSDEESKPERRQRQLEKRKRRLLGIFTAAELLQPVVTRMPKGPLPLSWARRVQPFHPEALPTIVDGQTHNLQKACGCIRFPILDTDLPPRVGSKFVGCLMDIPWLEKDSGYVTPSILAKYLRITDAVLPQGSFMFVWCWKELVPKVLLALERWFFTYVENVAWVQLNPNNTFVSHPGEYFNRSKLTLLICRKGAAKVSVMHQRNPDVVFDVLRKDEYGRSEKPVQVYDIIETLLQDPMSKGSRMLELFASGRTQRPGWVHVVDSHNCNTPWIPPAPVHSSAVGFIPKRYY